ncbi:MAG: hypothetical protein ABIM21_06600 [candidate division WOR-3 bacterium]
MVFGSSLNKLKSYGIRYILTGSILEFSGGTNPKVSIHARIIDVESACVAWAGFAGKTGEDYEGLLGLGRIKDVNILKTKVVSLLFKDFKNLKKCDDNKIRVATMILENLSKESLVGKMITYSVVTLLASLDSLNTLELGVIREEMVRRGILPRAEIDYIKLEGIRTALKVDYIVLGTVEEITESGFLGLPTALVSIKVVDAKNAGILFMGDRYLTGNYKEGILQMGRVRSAAIMGYEATREIVRDLKRRMKW